jgi:hypothetical protein
LTSKQRTGVGTQFLYSHIIIKHKNGYSKNRLGRFYNSRLPVSICVTGMQESRK